MFELGLLLLAIGCGALGLARLLFAGPAATGAGLGIAAVGVIALIMASCVREADAQPLCMPTPEFERALARLGEIEIGAGIVDVTHPRVLRVFASDAGRTFTMILTAATGASCLLAFGRDLDIAMPPPAAVDEREG